MRFVLDTRNLHLHMRNHRRVFFQQRPAASSVGSPVDSPQPHEGFTSGVALVSGDSHFTAVRDANLELRRPDGVRASSWTPGRGSAPHPHYHGHSYPHAYNAVPPPYHYVQRPPGGFDPRVRFSSPQNGYGPSRWESKQEQQQQHPRLANYRRQWISPQFASLPPQIHRFVVLSYNILADYLSQEHRWKLYPHIPNYILDWEWRKEKLLFEFGLWAPDIICLQEVDRFGDLEEKLKGQGYSGVWKMRTGTAVDGCAIFWRSTRFELQHEEHIEFNNLGLRDNVAQICVLKQIIPQADVNSNISPTSSQESTLANQVVVCNIHVLYNPKRGEVKLGQVRTLLDRAYNVSKAWNDAPVVICGDFNSTPQSPLYNFIAEQKLDFSGLARDEISGQSSAPSFARRPYTSRPSWLENCNDVSSARNLADSRLYRGVVPENNAECKNLQPDPSLENFEKRPNAVSSSKPAEGSGSEDPDKSMDSHTNYSAFSYGSASADSSCARIEGGSEDAVNLQTSTDHSSRELADHSWLSLQNDSESESLDRIFDAMTLENAPPAENSDQNFHMELLDSYPFEDLVPASLDQNKPSEAEQSPEVNKIYADVLEEYNQAESYIYDPYSWTPLERSTASGSEGSTCIEHKLELRSVYKDIKDYAGTKDSSGEPAVTSYHKLFMGTVDYIWCSESLQTVRVLDTIPAHILRQTEGFPTKKWGSDHIALACQLAFRNGISSQ